MVHLRGKPLRRASGWASGGGAESEISPFASLAESWSGVVLGGDPLFDNRHGVLVALAVHYAARHMVGATSSTAGGLISMGRASPTPPAWLGSMLRKS